MNSSALLPRVNLIHLKSRDRSRSVLCQVKRLPGRECMSPVAGADVVIGALFELAGGREESIDGPNRGALRVPTQNERLIVRVSESLAAADWTSNVGSQ